MFEKFKKFSKAVDRAGEITDRIGIGIRTWRLNSAVSNLQASFFDTTARDSVTEELGERHAEHLPVLNRSRAAEIASQYGHIIDPDSNQLSELFRLDVQDPQSGRLSFYFDSAADFKSARAAMLLESALSL